jgi:type I restriction enzyme, S subunit
VTCRLVDLLVGIQAGKSFGAAGRPAGDDEWGIVKVSAMTWGEFRPYENKAVTDTSRIDPRYEIRSGDVLVSRANTTEYVGAPVLVRHTRPRLLLSDKSLRLLPRAEVDPGYLHLIMSAPQTRKRISELATGTKDSMRNISQSALLQLEVPPLPPATEQRRIVELVEDHLSRLDAADGYLDAARRRLVAMERAALATCREGELQPLANVTAIQGGIQKQPRRAPKHNAHPFLRVANVTARGLELDDVHQIELFNGELDRLRLRAGDLLVVEGNGSASQIGRAAIWDGSIDDCVHQNHLIRVRPLDGLLPEYLEAVWNSPQNRATLTDVSSSSSGLHTLSVSKLKQLSVPVPSVQRQRELAEEVGAVREAKGRLGASIGEAIKRRQALRRALLAAAFSGRLTGATGDFSVADEMVIA